MPQISSIEWTHRTSNPIYFVDTRTGKRIWFCVHKSPGCEHCYAEEMQRRFGGGVDAEGNKVKALEFKAQNKQFIEAQMNDEELWKIIKLNNRLAKKNETTRMFCFDMTDLFGDFITDEMRDKFFAVVAMCPQITFQILTKRAKEMRDYFIWKQRRGIYAIDEIRKIAGRLTGKKIPRFEFPSHNLHLGVSVENQKTADERIPYLLETPAALRFLSVEPLLEEVDLEHLKYKNTLINPLSRRYGVNETVTPFEFGYAGLGGIDWVIVGGESGAKARLCDVNWIRSIVRQCKAANVPVFVKQLGTYPHEGGACYEFQFKSKKGGDITEFPEDLRVREFPQ